MNDTEPATDQFFLDEEALLHEMQLCDEAGEPVEVVLRFLDAITRVRRQICVT